MEKEIVKKIVLLCEKYNKKLYGVVSNMSIAMERRDFLQKFDCFICNQQEAGMFFSDDYNDKTPDEMQDILADCLKHANISSMVVTMVARELFLRNKTVFEASVRQKRTGEGYHRCG